MKNAPSKLLSWENSCTFKTMVSVWYLGGSKSLNECMTQKLSKFEYLKIYIRSVIIFYFVYLYLFVQVFKKIYGRLSQTFQREMKTRGTCYHWVMVWEGEFLALAQWNGHRGSNLSLEVCSASWRLANACVKTLLVLFCFYSGDHSTTGL